MSENEERANDTEIGSIVNTDTSEGSVDLSRRGVLGAAGLAGVAAFVGTNIPFQNNLREGFVPAAMADDTIEIANKDGLRVLNDRPLNAETMAHMLDDAITPTSRHFIRNNGIPPENTAADKWSLTIDGFVKNKLTLNIAELTKKFEVVELALQIECGGNGRSGFNPPAKGNQWSTGAVACSKWKGVRLADVLKAAGIKEEAIYTAHYGADTHLSGKPGKLPISRGLPIQKALEPHNLIAFEMNGAPLHPMNGAPLRLVIPGWPGSFSHKWLTRIQLRDVVHDGPKMTGKAYRVPAYPVAPGEKISSKDMIFIESMPVKSLITRPKTELKTSERTLEVGGHAWAGDNDVSAMHVSIDFGKTWQKAELDKPVNKYAWQNWKAQVSFPEKGYYEVWARATDDKGNMQPFAIAWNPKGYLNNSMHRIAVFVS